MRSYSDQWSRVDTQRDRGRAEGVKRVDAVWGSQCHSAQAFITPSSSAPTEQLYTQPGARPAYFLFTGWQGDVGRVLQVFLLIFSLRQDLW